MRQHRVCGGRVRGAARPLACALLCAAALIAACGGWSEEQRKSFLNDCLTNARLEDDVLRSKICTCWLERSAELYSPDELNGGDPKVQQDFERIVQDCAHDHGVQAYVPPLK